MLRELLNTTPTHSQVCTKGMGYIMVFDVKVAHLRGVEGLFWVRVGLEANFNSTTFILKISK